MESSDRSIQHSDQHVCRSRGASVASVKLIFRKLKVTLEDPKPNIIQVSSLQHNFSDSVSTGEPIGPALDIDGVNWSLSEELGREE